MMQWFMKNELSTYFSSINLKTNIRKKLSVKVLYLAYREHKLVEKKKSV